MKKFFIFIGLTIASAVLAIIVGVATLWLTDSLDASMSVTIFGWVLVALFMGVFDVDAKRAPMHDSLKDAARYHKAA